MNRLIPAALISLLTTLTALLALRAGDGTLALLAVAAVIVLLTWFATLHSTDDESGLPLVSPAIAVALGIAGRQQWGTVLPLIAAHAVGAIAAGFAALGLDGQLGAAQVGAEPSLAAAGVGGVVVGLFSTWAFFAIDGDATPAFAAVPVAIGGAVLPVAFAALLNPLAILGVATSGILDWNVALVAAGACLASAIAGAYSISQLLPRH